MPDRPLSPRRAAHARSPPGRTGSIAASTLLDGGVLDGEAGRGRVAASAERARDRADVVGRLRAQVAADLGALLAQQKRDFDALHDAYRLGEMLGLFGAGAGLLEVGVVDPRVDDAVAVRAREPRHRARLECERRRAARLIGEAGDLGGLDAGLDHLGGVTERSGRRVLVREAPGVGEERRVAAERDLGRRLDVECLEQLPHELPGGGRRGHQHVHVTVLGGVGMVVDHDERLGSLGKRTGDAEPLEVRRVERHEDGGRLQIARGRVEPEARAASDTSPTPRGRRRASGSRARRARAARG